MPGYMKKAAALEFPNSQEQAMALSLSRGGSVKAIQQVTVGSRGLVDVQIDRIITAAKAHHAASFVLVHNHPSAALRPSKADLAATFAIAEAGKSGVRKLNPDGLVNGNYRSHGAGLGRHGPHMALNRKPAKSGVAIEILELPTANDQSNQAELARCLTPMRSAESDGGFSLP